MTITTIARMNPELEDGLIRSFLATTGTKMIELTVSIKTEDATYKQKFLLYETFEMREGDPIIRDCIQKAQDKLNLQDDHIEDIKIRNVMVIQ